MDETSHLSHLRDLIFLLAKFEVVFTLLYFGFSKNLIQL